MGASDVMDLLYPKMMPIHTLAPDAMQPDEQGRIRLPRLMRCSYARMEPHGAYLIRTSILTHQAQSELTIIVKQKMAI